MDALEPTVALDKENLAMAVRQHIKNDDSAAPTKSLSALRDRINQMNRGRSAKDDSTKKESDENVEIQASLEGEVEQKPQNPVAWLNLLSHLQKDGVTTTKKLLLTFQKALRALPAEKLRNDETYLQIWLQQIRCQDLVSSDEAENSFRYMSAQRIGRHSATFWREWAKFHENAGHMSQAKSIVSKGINFKAEPLMLLKDALRKFEGSEDVTVPLSSLPPTPARMTPLANRMATTPNIKPPVVPSSTTTNTTAASSVSSVTNEPTVSLADIKASVAKMPDFRSEHFSKKEGTPRRTALLGLNLKIPARRLVAPGAGEIEATANAETDHNPKITTPPAAVEPVLMESKEEPKETEKENDLTDRVDKENGGGKEEEASGHKSDDDIQTAPLVVPHAGEKTVMTPQDKERNLKAWEAMVQQSSAQKSMPEKEVREKDPPKEKEVKERENEKEKEKSIATPHRRTERAHRAATDVAVVNGISYTLLETIGKGGSSKVYKVMGPHKKVYALKKVRLEGVDSVSKETFTSEIELLSRLKGKECIVELVDSYVSNSMILMVMECGDIDLAHMLHRQAGKPVNPNFIRLYWQQMLEAVKCVHEEHIIHSDLKPANFLFVQGTLKLIDFGIAKRMEKDSTSILRENQVGTLNYMSPESISGKVCGRASDIWSLGCILYQMVYGNTPFHHLAMWPKITAIGSDDYKISYPDLDPPDRALTAVLQGCLQRDPKSRLSMDQLLEHPFLHPEARVAANKEHKEDSTVVSVSTDQLASLLSQLGVSSQGNALAETIRQQLLSGGNIDLSDIVKQQ
jgi:serine/threonine-protein kinase TTK/MPS1